MIFRKIRLGDVAEMKYGKMPPKEFLSSDGFPVFSGYRITGYSKEYLYKEPKLVIVARGVGGTGDVKIAPENAWITNLCIVLTLSGQVDKKYLFYKLRLEPLKANLDSGAAQSQITIDALKNYNLRIHEIESQKNIARFITLYDSLVENNLRRIELLEESVRLLFREWFVLLRFPGHEHTKITKGVPEGWGKKTLIEIADLTMGQSPESK